MSGKELDKPAENGTSFNNCSNEVAKSPKAETSFMLWLDRDIGKKIESWVQQYLQQIAQFAKEYSLQKTSLASGIDRKPEA